MEFEFLVIFSTIFDAAFAFITTTTVSYRKRCYDLKYEISWISVNHEKWRKSGIVFFFANVCVTQQIILSLRSFVNYSRVCYVHLYYVFADLRNSLLCLYLLEIFLYLFFLF